MNKTKEQMYSEAVRQISSLAMSVMIADLSIKASAYAALCSTPKPKPKKISFYRHIINYFK